MKMMQCDRCRALANYDTVKESWLNFKVYKYSDNGIPEQNMSDYYDLCTKCADHILNVLFKEEVSK
jgi:hypothetical protein